MAQRKKQLRRRGNSQRVNKSISKIIMTINRTFVILSGKLKSVPMHILKTVILEFFILYFLLLSISLLLFISLKLEVI